MNRNYAFIEMETIEDATKARNGANATVLHGDHITVEYANTTMMQNRRQRFIQYLYNNNQPISFFFNSIFTLLQINSQHINISKFYRILYFIKMKSYYVSKNKITIINHKALITNT